MSARKIASRAAALLTQLRVRSPSVSCPTMLFHQPGCQHRRFLGSSSSVAPSWSSSTPQHWASAGAADSSAAAFTLTEDVENGAGDVDTPSLEASTTDDSAHKPTEPSAPAVGPSAPAGPGSSGRGSELEQFSELWEKYMEKLAAKGFLQDTPEMRVSNSQRSELGVIKRANLEMSRQRIDILYSLPREKLEALSKQDLPYQDRKVCPRCLRRHIGAWLCALSFHSAALRSGGTPAHIRRFARFHACALVQCSANAIMQATCASVGLAGKL